MIFGNPDDFALQFDIVDGWNTPGDTWRNGVFSMYVGGERVFHFVDVLELRTISGFYRTLRLKCDTAVCDVDAARLYEEAHSYFYGDSDALRAGLMTLVCTAMEDRSCFVYLMRCASHDRFIWRIDEGQGVHEYLCSSSAVNDALEGLSACAALK
jgi:hypothetical protein